MKHTLPALVAGTTYFVQSYAKINLTLDVLGKRSDGYHELSTIMQTIDLYDTICLTATDDQQVSILCSRSELSNADNLVVRAAQAVREHCELTQGVAIELHKRVPLAAGLGGGSSNAAAVLLALQQWWQLSLSADDLLNLAASLGSDVPFFLAGALALCEGRGELITPLPAHWPASMRWLLLLKPSISVSTATVFRNLAATEYTTGTCSRTVAEILQNQRTLQTADLHNGLQRSVLDSYPQVEQARTAMLQAGAPFVQLSGSGPTLFAPFATLSDAAQVQQQLQRQGYETYLTRPIYPPGVPVYYF